MERHRLLEAFRSAAVEVLSIDEDAVTEAACLGEDLGANSLDLVEVVLILEHDLGLSVADEALVNICTVADVLDVILAGQTDHKQRDRRRSNANVVVLVLDGLPLTAPVRAWATPMADRPVPEREGET
jgi:acyl carrier protein